MWSTTRICLKFDLFLYENNMKQAVNCDLFPYADDSCLVYQHNNVSKIERNLNKSFSNIWDCFADNEVSIHFGEDWTKCIQFGTKQKLKKTGSLDIIYGIIQIWQYFTVIYVGCALHENFSGETITLKAN